MKIGRQAKIIELIGKYDIETQEDLCAKLNAEGYDVTQARVARGGDGRCVAEVRDAGLTEVPPGTITVRVLSQPG